jgi:hypothetical protein
MLAEDGLEFDLHLINNQFDAAYRNEQCFNNFLLARPQIDIFELEGDPKFCTSLLPA